MHSLIYTSLAPALTSRVAIIVPSTENSSGSNDDNNGKMQFRELAWHLCSLGFSQASVTKTHAIWTATDKCSQRHVYIHALTRRKSHGALDGYWRADYYSSIANHRDYNRYAPRSDSHRRHSLNNRSSPLFLGVYFSAVFSIVFPYSRIRSTLPIPYILSRTGSVNRIRFLIQPVYYIEISIRTVRARIRVYGSGDLGV